MAVNEAELREIYFQVQRRLKEIELLLGPNHKLTLVARYVGKKPIDADIILTLDDLDLVKGSIEGLKNRAPRFKPGDPRSG